MVNRLYREKGVPRLACELEVLDPPAAADRTVSAILRVKDRQGRPVEDVVPDHGKMMHLIALDLPEATDLHPVHPRMDGPGASRFRFTPSRTGTYKVFGDLLRRTGEGETVTALLEIREGGQRGSGLLDDPDDSRSMQPAVGSLPVDADSYPLGGGFWLRWDRSDSAASPLRAGEFLKLAFEVVDAEGEIVHGLEPYMGMRGNLLILRWDGSVFAHVHPMGTLAGRMPAGMSHSADAAPMVHAGAGADHAHESARVTFPYGFPEPGMYRLWVQVKRQGKMYTGLFDTRVD